MKDEIKEIERILATSGKYITYAERCYVLDYITNLQEEVKSANESITWWQNRFNALQEENKRLNKKYEDAVADYEEQKYIINELEKWLESEIDRINKLKSPKKGVPPYGEENYYYENMILRYKEVLDKLKELKEDK